VDSNEKQSDFDSFHASHVLTMFYPLKTMTLKSYGSLKSRYSCEER
jgi:hypothetical protein